MKVYSIGFEQRTLQELARELEDNKVAQLIDVRCFPEADSAGYAKGSQLRRDLKNITYIHMEILAPTPELLKDYFERGVPWIDYEKSYLSLLESRKVETVIDPSIFETSSCMMCLEHDPEKCHRRLALEYLNYYWSNFEICHL